MSAAVPAVARLGRDVLLGREDLVHLIARIEAGSRPLDRAGVGLGETEEPVLADHRHGEQDAAEHEHGVGGEVVDVDEREHDDCVEADAEDVHHGRANLLGDVLAAHRALQRTKERGRRNGEKDCD